MSLDRDLIDSVRELNEHELRRLLMLATARLEVGTLPAGPDGPNVRFRAQRVRCGKPTCTTCPHGPYWYAYWWEEGRRRSCYVGKLEGEPTQALADGILSRHG